MTLLLLFNGEAEPDPPVELEIGAAVSTNEVSIASIEATETVLLNVGAAVSTNEVFIAAPTPVPRATIGVHGEAKTGIGYIGVLPAPEPAPEPEHGTPTPPAGAILARPDRPGRCTVELYEGLKQTDPTFGTRIAILDAGFDKKAMVELSGTGSGQVSIAGDDPIGSVADYGHVLRYKVDGRTLQSAIIENIDYVHTDDSEGASEVRTFRGRGVASVLDQAIVYPWSPAGSDGSPGGVSEVGAQRVFNFASPTMVTPDTAIYTWIDIPGGYTGWAPREAAVGPVAGWRAATRVPDSAFGSKGPFPDQQARWIWDRNTAVAGAPTGTCYFRCWFRVTDPAGSNVQVWAEADDNHDTWIDGISVLRQDDWYKGEASSATVKLTPGWHLIAARVNNLGGGRAGYKAAVIVTDSAGELTQTVLASTGNGPWNVKPYPPDPPGSTAGQIMRMLIDEAWHRFAIPQVRLTCGDLLDSNGVPWDTIEAFTVDVGTTLLEVLEQLGVADCDWRCRPTSFHFDLVRYGTYGTNRPITLERGVNMSKHEANGKG